MYMCVRGTTELLSVETKQKNIEQFTSDKSRIKNQEMYQEV